MNIFAEEFYYLNGVNTTMRIVLFPNLDYSFELENSELIVRQEGSTSREPTIRTIYVAETGKFLPLACSEQNYLATVIDGDYVLHLFDVTGEVESGFSDRVVYRYTEGRPIPKLNSKELTTVKGYKGAFSTWAIVDLSKVEEEEEEEEKQVEKQVEGIPVHFLYEKVNGEVRQVHGRLMSMKWVNGQQLWFVQDETRNDIRSFYFDSILRPLGQHEVEAWQRRGF